MRSWNILTTEKFVSHFKIDCKNNPKKTTLTLKWFTRHAWI